MHLILADVWRLFNVRASSTGTISMNNPSSMTPSGGHHHCHAGCCRIDLGCVTWTHGTTRVLCIKTWSTFGKDGWATYLFSIHSKRGAHNSPSETPLCKGLPPCIVNMPRPQYNPQASKLGYSWVLICHPSLMLLFLPPPRIFHWFCLTIFFLPFEFLPISLPFLPQFLVCVLFLWLPFHYLLSSW